MLRNLKIEWLKIRSYRTFWIIAILFFICTVGVDFIVYHFKSDSGTPPEISMIFGNPFDFPDVWQTITYVSSFLLFLPGLLLLILTTNEFNFRTSRQNIIDGISRFDFAFTKIVLAIIFSLASTVFVALLALLFGLASGGAALTGAKVYFVFYFFLQALTYSLAGVLFGFLIKRSGLAITLYLIYIAFIKNIISAVVNHFTATNGGDYFPVKSADSLIPFPFFRMITNQIFTPPNTTFLLIATAVYLAAFYFVIIKKFSADDL